MRNYTLFFIAIIILALVLPRTGVIPRDGEITVKMEPDGIIAKTPTYEPPPPNPYEYTSETVQGCDFPAVPENAKLVLLSAYDTQSVSSTALADEERVAVGAGTLTIEEGDTPLYIVLVSFDPVIWQVKGAVDRVRYLVLAAEETTGSLLRPNEPRLETLVGATGIDANKLRFLQNHKCMHYFKGKDTPQAALAVEAIRHYLGRKPDMVAGIEHVNGFAAPSGEIDTLSPPFWSTLFFRLKAVLGLLQSAETGLEYNMESWYPGGVVDVDPKSVVSPHEARPYSVLPQEAGMLQLLDRGDLTPDMNGRDVFTIKRPIRFPAGLYGGHSHHFLLAPGVAMPTGIAGHSCVMSQQTGQVVLSGDGFC